MTSRNALLVTASVMVSYCVVADDAYSQASVRAVAFGSNTYLSNNGAGILPPPNNYSYRVSWSCWYHTGNLAQNTEHALFASYLHGAQPQLVVEVSLDNTYQLGGVPNGTHVKMTASDGGFGGQVMTALTDTTVPTDSHWHQIMGAWDTSNWFPNRGMGQYGVAATIDNVWMQWDTVFTGGAFNTTPQSFATPYVDLASRLANNWTHGAMQDPAKFTVTQYVQSDLAECVFNNNVENVSQFFYSVADDDGRIFPLSLGPLCLLATGTIPPLCFRGNASAYPTNVFGAGDDFTVNGTSLVTAPDDPWTLP